jgi:hypothetical protein
LESSFLGSAAAGGTVYRGHKDHTSAGFVGSPACDHEIKVNARFGESVELGSKASRGVLKRRGPGVHSFNF